MKKVVALGLVMLSTQAFAAVSGSAVPDDSSVVGSVNGKSVTLGEVQNQKIHELRQELSKELENAFISEAITRLSKTNKEFKGITIPEVQEEEVRKLYVERGLSFRGSYEQLAPQIRQYLTNMRQAKAEYDLYKIAEDKGQVLSNIVEPGPFLVSIPVETAYVHGKKNGAVMLLEFSDFQCPYCKKVQPALRSLVNKYRDKVAFAYRHMPLAFHQEADGSAVAAECAREQGKFMEMHASLYQQQSKQSINDLKNIAKEIGIADTKKFDTCLDEARYGALVAHDIEVAQSIGINGTPAFVIGKYDSKNGMLNGEIISGAQPVSVLEEALKSHMDK